MKVKPGRMYEANKKKSKKSRVKKPSAINIKVGKHTSLGFKGEMKKLKVRKKYA